MPPNHGSNSQTHLPGIPVVPPHKEKKHLSELWIFSFPRLALEKTWATGAAPTSGLHQPSTVLVAPFLAQLAPENRSYPYIFTKVKFFPFRTPATPCENVQNLQRKVSLQTLSNDERNPVPSSIRQYFGLTTICGNTLDELHGGSWWQYTDTDGVPILFTKLSVPEVQKLYLAHQSEHSHVANKVVVSIHRFPSVSL